MMFELVIESFHSIDIFVHVAPELPNVQSNLSGNFFHILPPYSSMLGFSLSQFYMNIGIGAFKLDFDTENFLICHT